MTRTHANYHLTLLFLALLCALHIACGSSSTTTDGNTNQNNDTQDTTECSVDDDCADGYTCSAAGACTAFADEADLLPTACTPAAPSGAVLYVATDGSDAQDRDGSESAPFATITYALDRAADGTVILVKPGLYNGRVRIRGAFTTGVTIRSQVPYMARLRNSDRVITAYQDSRGCSGITIEGFDIAHTGPGADALVVHLDAAGTGAVTRLTMRNNVLHDSYNNDILKINNGISDIVVERNLFYNQSGSDEHIDINSAERITVQDNIFMNDFAGSGRTNANDTSSYIVVKDSNGAEDRFTGSRAITIRRNVFLNWEGSSGNNFVLLGEDGKNFYEAREVLIENNLMLGNSANVMRAPFSIKGGRDITFRNNTIVGDLPALAFAMRFNREGDNPINTDIAMYNNIWSDPTGTMGATAAGSANDFSDTPLGDVADYTLSNNLYWNGGSPIPYDGGEVINATDDLTGIIADPGLDDQSALILPRWVPNSQQFADGSSTICEAFETLVYLHGIPAGDQAIDSADADHAPDHDILGEPRGDQPDVGAVEAY